MTSAVSQKARRDGPEEEGMAYNGRDDTAKNDHDVIGAGHGRLAKPLIMAGARVPMRAARRHKLSGFFAAIGHGRPRGGPAVVLA